MIVAQEDQPVIEGIPNNWSITSQYVGNEPLVLCNFNFHLFSLKKDIFQMSA